jgi:predicted nucleic acid-binding protein
MFLVDTNVWLELLLEQKKAKDVRGFLGSVDSNLLFITDFAFHSIEIVLTELEHIEALLQFVQDTFLDGAVHLIHLKPSDIKSIVAVMNDFNLDFDDAYQYVAAEQYGLTIISFDSDFNRTEKGYKTPGKII